MPIGGVYIIFLCMVHAVPRHVHLYNYTSMVWP